MITRIELTNFMSHKHTVIEPAAGLTVLVGPNNIGKSAIVAALQILCYNENSTYVLRHGERECSVKVITDDGHTVEWRRKNSPSYVIDGQTFDRLRGSGLPDELHQVLRLSKVDTSGDADIDIHFGSQKSPIFLLGNSAANAARFFASSSDAIRLVQIQKRHKEKLAEAQREKNHLEAESRRLNAELESLEPMVEVDRRLGTAEQAHADLIQNQAWLGQAQEHEAALREQAAVLTRRAAILKAISPLSPPPDLIPIEPIEDLVTTLSVVERKLAESNLQAQALHAIVPPPELVPTDALAELITKTESADSGRSAACARVDAVSQLPEPPPIVDTDPLQKLVGHLETSVIGLAAVADRSAALKSVACPPNLENEAPLRDVVDQLCRGDHHLKRWRQMLASLTNTMSTPVAADTSGMVACVAALEQAATKFRACSETLAAAEVDLESAGADLRARSADSLCPVCGNTLDAERVIARAIAGQRGHEHG
jgi:exonuclease SbcC